jgi:hypothetical protein
MRKVEWCSNGKAVFFQGNCSRVQGVRDPGRVSYASGRSVKDASRCKARYATARTRLQETEKKIDRSTGR